MAEAATVPETHVRRVHCVTDGAIGWLRLDNQPRLNAVSLSMWKDLDAGVTRLAEDPAIRVIIVAGAGGKAFCAGGDISEFSAMDSDQNSFENYARAGHSANTNLLQVQKPTIAMIEGFCLGGGVAIALRCDLRIAAENARLGIPAAKRGLSYDYSSIKILTDLMGPAATKHILYTGRQYSAAESLRMGLVNEIHAPDKLEQHVRELALSIAANAPLSIKATKLVVDTAVADPYKRNMDACKAAQDACLASEDYAEATKSFMEKRPPVFKGR